MGTSKTLEFAIAAIKNLKDIRGSSSRDILNYIKKQYNEAFDVNAVKKQIHASLKRGVACGILKRDNAGNYTFPIETESAGEEIAAQELKLMEIHCKKRRNNNCINNNNGQRRKRSNIRKNSKKCRKPMRKKCGKSCLCPCSGSCSCSSACSNNRRNKINNKRCHGSAAEASFSRDSEEDANCKNIEKRFHRSFHSSKRRRRC